MKLLLSFICPFMTASLLFAASNSTIVCDAGEYTVSAFEVQANEGDSLGHMVFVQKGEKGVYSKLYNLYYEATPQEAWILREDSEQEDGIMAVVGTSQTTALADISIDLQEEGILRVSGADCELSSGLSNLL